MLWIAPSPALPIARAPLSNVPVDIVVAAAAPPAAAAPLAALLAANNAGTSAPLIVRH